MEAVSSPARAVGMSSVAEGIETVGQPMAVANPRMLSNSELLPRRAAAGVGGKRYAPIPRTARLR